MKHFKDASIGLVGPVTNNIGNEARINVHYTALDYMHCFAENYTLSHLSEGFDIKTLAMFCAGIRKELVETVGLLDERFGIGSFEDDEYSTRIQNAGLRILCVEDVLSIILGIFHLT